MHSKFQVPSVFAVQMNAHFVSFKYRDLMVLHVLYLQENPDLKKYILTGYLQITKLVFGPSNSRDLNLSLVKYATDFIAKIIET